MSHGDERRDIQSVLDAYFEELDAALSGLSRAKRKQLTGEIRLHVDEAIAEQPPSSPAELRNLLDRVGLPEDIAAAALDVEPGQPRQPLRPWHMALIIGIAVVLTGTGAGIGLALSARKGPAHSPAAASIPTARRTTSPSTSPSPPIAVATRPSPTPQPTITSAPATSPSTTAPANTVPANTVPANTGAQPSTGTPANLAVLAPAAVQPVSAECTERVTYEADGNVTPLTCPNGGVNTIAWHVYAYGQSGTTPDSSQLLSLGRYASPARVYQAMCYDDVNVYKTGALTERAEEIAQAYYGWQFAGGTPLQEFETDGCPTSP
jgi:hypothetical protein